MQQPDAILSSRTSEKRDELFDEPGPEESCECSVERDRSFDGISGLLGVQPDLL